MPDNNGLCPRLPPYTALLTRRLPAGLIGSLVQPVLNKTFASALADGQLDELAARELAIVIDDLDFTLGFRLRNGKLQAGSPQIPATTIRGPLAAYLWLASGACDADSLFFNRQLLMEGDTDLGLIVKNVIDATGLDTLPAALRAALKTAVKLVPAQAPGRTPRSHIPASPYQ